MSNVREIVKERLVRGGYDGLASGSCGCGLEDLMCCGEDASKCRPARAVAWPTCERAPECPFGHNEESCTGCYSCATVVDEHIENYQALRAGMSWVRRVLHDLLRL